MAVSRDNLAHTCHHQAKAKSINFLSCNSCSAILALQFLQSLINKSATILAYPLEYLNSVVSTVLSKFFLDTFLHCVANDKFSEIAASSLSRKLVGKAPFGQGKFLSVQV
jgi:hypothetical protein